MRKSSRRARPLASPSPQLSFSETALDDEESVEVIWVTGPLAHDSPAPEVEAALEALTGIDDVAVDVELLHGGHGGRIFSVVWPMDAGSRNVPQLRVNGSGLTPAGSEEEAAAVAFVNEVHCRILRMFTTLAFVAIGHHPCPPMPQPVSSQILVSKPTKMDDLSNLSI